MFSEISIHEVHHQKKIDAPSGTAKELKNILDSNFLRSKTQVSSIRGGTVVGEHEITFFSEYEQIHVKHICESKELFAKNTLKVAEFISEKENGFYGMKDIIDGWFV